MNTSDRTLEITDQQQPGTGNANAEAAHETYLAESHQLIDEHVAELFDLLTRLATSTGAATPSEVDVQRQGHTLSIGRGNHRISAVVAAITDLDRQEQPAQAFPTGQARCTITLPDGTSVVYVLHRAGYGNEVNYRWMLDRTETPLDEAQLGAVLQAAL